jgi:hypothetical protein
MNGVRFALLEANSNFLKTNKINSLIHGTCLCDKDVDIKFSAHDAILESQKTYKCLGAINRMAETG